MKVAKNGDVVHVNYEGYLNNGEVFDSSYKRGEPLIFKIGDKLLLQKFEESVIGLEVGKEVEISLQPNEAYGDVDNSLVITKNKGEFDKSFVNSAVVGSLVQTKSDDGNLIAGKIIHITNDELVFDFNHPRAGEVLNFKIKLEKIA